MKKVDVVLLESVDGRPHYELALPVLKAGKRMFIDKPISSSLSGAMKIFKESEKYKVNQKSIRFLYFLPRRQDLRRLLLKSLAAQRRVKFWELTRTVLQVQP